MTLLIIKRAGRRPAPQRTREASNDNRNTSRLDNVKKNYDQKFLNYHDKRLAKIAEGYLLQAVFYYMTGDAFCDSLDCRLNNAHWQKDLLYSQLKIGKLCDKHQALLDN